MARKKLFLYASESWVYPSFVWLIQLLVALLVSFLFSHIFASSGGDGFYPMFQAWDGGFYLHIAEIGYSRLQVTAFYPLYPLLIRLLHTITGFSFPLSGFIISNVCLLIALIFLYRFILNEHEPIIAKYTLWLLTAFPVAMFYHCVYTESLNLMCLVLFFYCLQQNRWYLAMIAGGLAAITHGFGMLLILPAIAYLWQQRRNLNGKTLTIRIISLLLIFVGVILYMIYLYFRTGTPFAFVFAHKFWNHQTEIPIVHIITFLYHILSKAQGPMHHKIIQTIHGVFSLFMVLMGVLMLIFYRNRFSFPIQLFYVVAVLLSISSGPGGHLDSFARYEMVLFPGFIVWAYFCRNREFVFLLTLSIMLPLKTVLLGTFVNGYWIT